MAQAIPRTQIDRLWKAMADPARRRILDLLRDRPQRTGGTKLRFADTMYGRVTAGTIASMTEGWNYLFGKAFKDYAEEGTRPPRLLSPVMLRESTCF